MQLSYSDSVVGPASTILYFIVVNFPIPVYKISAHGIKPPLLVKVIGLVVGWRGGGAQTNYHALIWQFSVTIATMDPTTTVYIYIFGENRSFGVFLPFIILFILSSVSLVVVIVL